MQAGDQILGAILSCVENGSLRADHVMGFIFDGIENSMKEAEFAMRRGEKEQAALRLRELQALAERVIGIVTPHHRKIPRLVAITP
jgi:hypothetical protein